MIRNRNKSTPVPESVMIQNMEFVLMEHQDSNEAAAPRGNGRNNERRRGSNIELKPATNCDAPAGAAGASSERINARRKRRSQKALSRDESLQSLKEHNDSTDSTTQDTTRPSLPTPTVVIPSHSMTTAIDLKTEECNLQEGGNVLMEQSDQDNEKSSRRPKTRVTYNDNMPLSELAGLLIALQAPTSQQSKPK